MKLLFRGYLHLFISTFVGSALTDGGEAVDDEDGDDDEVVADNVGDDAVENSDVSSSVSETAATSLQLACFLEDDRTGVFKSLEDRFIAFENEIRLTRHALCDLVCCEA